MRVSRSLFAALAVLPPLAGGLHAPAEAGAKIIRVKPYAGGPARARGARILRYGITHAPGRRYFCCTPPGTRIYRHDYAPEPWSDRHYLRGPDFPPVNDLIQSHFEPSPTIPNSENIFRQRIKGGKTVEQGSIWAGHFKGGKTVEQGSPWAGRISGGRTSEQGSPWRSRTGF